MGTLLPCAGSLPGESGMGGPCGDPCGFPPSPALRAANPAASASADHGDRGSMRCLDLEGGGRHSVAFILSTAAWSRAFRVAHHQMKLQNRLIGSVRRSGSRKLTA